MIEANKKFSVFANPIMSGGKRAKEKASRIAIYILLGVISIIWILPFLYLLIQSFAVNYQANLIIPNE